MRKIYKNSFALQTLFHGLTGFLTKNVNNYLNFYSVIRPSRNIGNISVYFETAGGAQIPVYENYRYSVKPGWKYFSALSSLHSLIKKDLASLAEKEFFHTAKGTRTLTKPLSEIEAVAKKAHRVLFSKLKSFGVDAKIQLPSKLLEIGYISGGFSIFAFEKLGFEAYGIDNFYGNEARKSPLTEYIKKKTGSSVRFISGDITRETDFNNNELDVIYSASVLEHINNLAEAFKEMHRILKPGGVMIHGYNPLSWLNASRAIRILDWQIWSPAPSPSWRRK
jgi:SAM-dependent methyltransferase